MFLEYSLSPFSLSGIFLISTGTILLIILAIYGRTKLHRIWMLFNISIAIWGAGSFYIGRASGPAESLMAWKSSFPAVIFISVFFYHFISLFCQINRFKTLLFVYLQGLFFVLLNYSDIYISQVYYFRDSIYYLKSTGFFFPLSIAIWFLIVLLAIIELVAHLNKASNLKKIQGSYLLVGFVVGFSGGIANFLPVFGINVYPYGNFTIPIYCIIASYAILRYQLLDIKVAITRTGIFLIVYTFILGIPVWLGLKTLGKGLWLGPMTLMGFFALVGPFIYLFIQKRAEDRLLKEQKTYQATLRQASAGMGRIKDLNKLLNMIVFILTRKVRLEHSVIYILDEIEKKYKIGALKCHSSKSVFKETISKESSLIVHLEKNYNPIIFEETKQKAQDYKDVQMTLVANDIQELEAALVVPIYIGNDLIALVCMGKKISGKSFSEDDLAVFAILANQAALAIENANFYEDMKITQQQLFQAEKMATIGTMADGLLHQINNRFHALGFIAGDALDTIKLSKDFEMSDKLKDVFKDLEKAFNRVQDNVVQGGEVVQGLLRYTRKGQDGFVATDVDIVISNAYEMAQFKIKSSQMSLIRSYDKDTLPKVKGNSTQLQEVFFNLIDNAYDAMMQRKNERDEPNYHPTLNIYAKAKGENLEMIFQDNGIGVKEEDVKKLFTPFFTTKLSSKKGTGLGLYVIRKIIEDNHKGKVEFASRYLQGTQMKIYLPLST